MLIRKLSNSITVDDINPLELYKNREYINNLSLEEKELLVKRGEIWLDISCPDLPFNLYREYKETGNRQNFQEQYDKRRFALNDLFFAELVENNFRFVSKIIEYLYAILSEVVWWLPAHNVYQRDGINSGYPDPSNPIIALFCAETASQISIVVSTLEDKLPIELINYTNKQLEERIFTPYENMKFWWMADDGEFVNNWAPWCTQNVLISYACSLKFDKIRMLGFIGKAIKTLDNFLDSYGDDGCCEEGPQYFHLAGVSLFGAIEVINQCSSDKLSSIYKNKKIKNIAAYIQKVHIDGPYFVNFGDCNSKAGDCSAKEYLFAKRVGNQNLINFLAKNWLTVKDKLLIGERNLFDKYLLIKYIKELNEISIKSFENKVLYSKFTEFSSKGLYIFRSNKNVLAVQAGSNFISHNHNDTGSFIYYKNNKPLFIDVGVEEYTEKSFSDLRYTIWTMRSTYHNLTNFNNLEQIYDEDSKCIIKSVDSSSISMELANTYPKTKELRSYIRNLKLVDNSLIIEDIIDSSMSGTLTLMVESPVTIINNYSIKIGNDEIAIEGGVNSINCESIKIEDTRLKVSLPPTIYRITINYKKSIIIKA